MTDNEFDNQFKYLQTFDVITIAHSGIKAVVLSPNNPNRDRIELRPVYMRDDIGNGAGQTKEFTRDNMPLISQVIKGTSLSQNHIGDIHIIQHDCLPIINLTKLQEELGYVKGEISTVAMLGLVGEAGEVFSECDLFIDTETLKSTFFKEVTSKCREVEELKKRIRKGNDLTEVILRQSKVENFDKELADVFYYLNILATNRGLTVFDLAQMAHDKVRAKQAAGGSSEDPKKS